MDKVNFVTVDLVERLKYSFLYRVLYRNNKTGYFIEVFVDFDYELNSYMLTKAESVLESGDINDLSHYERKEFVREIFTEVHKKINPELYL